MVRLIIQVKVIFVLIKEFVNASIDINQIINKKNVDLIYDMIDEVIFLTRKNKGLLVWIFLINFLIKKLVKVIGLNLLIQIKFRKKKI